VARRTRHRCPSSRGTTLQSATANEKAVRCVVVLGATATGKTALGVALARRFGGEIVSADSRQLYRGMDVGTGKDLEEYGVGSERVPYHLIDIADPGDDYHLFRYVADARHAIHTIRGRGRLPIVVGGTALYINALLNQYDLEGGEPDPVLREELDALSDEELLDILLREAPDVLGRTDRTQRRRIIRAVEIARTRRASSESRAPVLDALLIGPFYPRKEIHQRIEKRLDARLANGMLEEVARLHAGGLSWERLDFFGLEYRYAAQHLRGELDFATFRATLLARIRRLCKSQEIWFRKMEREGKVIHWLAEGDIDEASKLVAAFLAGAPLPEPSIRISERLYGPRTS